MSLAALYSRLNAARRELAENNRKLARLRPARASLQQRAARIEANAQDQKHTAQRSGTYCGWEGINRMKIQDELAFAIPSAYSRYVWRVYSVVDEVDETIEQLERSNDELNARIRMLEAMIRDMLEDSED